MAQNFAASRRQVRPRRAVALAAALAGCTLAARAAIEGLQLFVNPAAAPSVRGLVARRAEGFPEPKQEEEDGGGFMKFLKVEQDIELSPEEYALAMEAEMDSLRKRYYIGGEVKPGNLIVPWKPVDEVQLEKDARRQLKKNGIKDPSGTIVDMDEEDSKVDIMLIGEQDVKLEWAGGAPATKVGYIIERKRAQDMNFQEIATYENMATSFLLAKQYAGHEYSYNDELLKPGDYTYRVLCRYRSGEVNVVDKRDITVPELSGVDSGAALAVLGAVSVLVVVGSFLLDQPVK